jgi:hypothetical protein
MPERGALLYRGQGRTATGLNRWLPRLRPFRPGRFPRMDGSGLGASASRTRQAHGHGHVRPAHLLAQRRQPRPPPQPQPGGRWVAAGGWRPVGGGRWVAAGGRWVPLPRRPDEAVRPSRPRAASRWRLLRRLMGVGCEALPGAGIVQQARSVGRGLRRRRPSALATHVASLRRSPATASKAANAWAGTDEERSLGSALPLPDLPLRTQRPWISRPPHPRRRAYPLKETTTQDAPQGRRPPGTALKYSTLPVPVQPPRRTDVRAVQVATPKPIIYRSRFIILIDA